jgi:hypothetical protein
MKTLGAPDAAPKGAPEQLTSGPPRSTGPTSQSHWAGEALTARISPPLSSPAVRSPPMAPSRRGGPDVLAEGAGGAPG